MDIKRLWAPWRIAYVRGDSTPDQDHGKLLNGADPSCFMCRAAAEVEPGEATQSRHRELLVVERTAEVIVLLNRYPYSNGHLLVAPVRHFGELEEIATATHDAIYAKVRQYVPILRSIMSPDGFNIGLNLGEDAGAGVATHLHWHIVPRWQGDHNFMTSLAATRVISQALDELHRVLLEHRS